MWNCDKCNQPIEEEEKVCYHCGEGLRPERDEITDNNNFLSEQLDKVHHKWITTSNSFEGCQIDEYLGPVHSNIVLGTNIFSDFLAGVTDVFGGRSLDYENKINKLYSECYDIISEQAKRKTANAIIGLKINFDEFSGKGKAMMMISMVGTAVKIKDK